jgi:hypothetical protein
MRINFLFKIVPFLLSFAVLVDKSEANKAHQIYLTSSNLERTLGRNELKYVELVRQFKIFIGNSLLEGKLKAIIKLLILCTIFIQLSSNHCSKEKNQNQGSMFGANLKPY